MDKYIVDIDMTAMQAWKSKGLPAMRRKVENDLIERRERLVAKFRAEGRQAYCWGYTRRKTLQTPFGDIAPLRIPRLRVDGREARLIPRQVRRTATLDLDIARMTLGGMSQRRLGEKYSFTAGMSMSAATVGKTIADLAGRVASMRSDPIVDGEYFALAVDAVGGKYRKGPKASLMVALGIKRNGDFDLLDWQAGEHESADGYERLFNRLYSRGLRSVELVVADGMGGIRSAMEMVYPNAEFQPCLWHWERTLIQTVDRRARERFHRDFWEVYNSLTTEELIGRALRFRRYLYQVSPTAAKSFERGFTESVQHHWRYETRLRKRLRTVNLAENFFRHFRRFFSRWPGFKDERHFSHVIGIYMLASKPEVRLRRTPRAA